MVIWVDYNDNGTFDTGEMIYSKDDYNVPNGGAATTAFTPNIVGTHRMRVMLVKNTEKSASSILPCGSYENGEAEDYLINVQPSYCKPQRPTNSGTELKVDLIERVKLETLDNSETRSKTVSYYNKTSGYVVPDLNIGQTHSFTIKAQGGNKHNCVVWIDFNNDGTFQSTEKVGMTTTIGGGEYSFNITIPSGESPGKRRMRVLWQYNSNADDNYYNDKPCTADAWGQTEDYTVNIIGCQPISTQSTDYIKEFSTSDGVTNISNASGGLSTNGYGDFYGTHSASATAGSTLSFYELYNGGSHGFSIWVDWNKNGTFEPAEKVFNATALSNSSQSGSFTIPSGTALGDYRMRIRAKYGDLNISPCGSISYGETEDYKLTIVNCTPTVPTCAGLNAPIDNATSQPRCGINLTWTAPTNTGCNGATSYDVYFGTSSTPPLVTNVSITTYIVPGNLNPSTVYYWRIVPKNAKGDASGCTTIYKFTTTSTVCNPGPGGVADGLTTWFKASSLSNGKVDSWTDGKANKTVSQSVENKKPIKFTSSTDITKSKEINFNDGVWFDGVTGATNDADGDELLNTNSSEIKDIVGVNGTIFLAHSPKDWSTNLAMKDYTTSDGSRTSYQFKPGQVGYSGGADWQRSLQSVALPYTYDFQARISVMAGGTTSSNTWVSRNGSKGSGTTNLINPGYGASIGEGLSFGSRGSFQSQNREYSNTIIPEMFTFNRVVTDAEREAIESYLAIKYGITLGSNGTSKDYKSSDGTIVWKQSTNVGFNYDIAGVGRDDVSTLEQKKSHSVNKKDATTYSDILTIAKGTNFSSPANFSADNQFLMWGNDGKALMNVLDPHPNITVFNIDDAQSENIESVLERHWKAQKTGTVGDVTLEFDLSQVPGATAIGDNDLTKIRLLVSETNNFTSSGTIYSLKPTSYDNTTKKVYFIHNFHDASGMATADNNGKGHHEELNAKAGDAKGYYFTIGSVNFNVAPLPIELTSFSGNCKNGVTTLTWTTATETDVNHFEIMQSTDGIEWKQVGETEAVGNSSHSNTYTMTARQLEEITYYRLISEDNDGAREAFNPISVQCKGQNPSWFVYPIPVTNKANVSIVSNEKKTVRVTLVDINGRILETKNWLILVGTNQFEWNVQSLASGVYFIQMEDEQFQPLKFMKE